MSIDYDILIHRSMHGVIREALQIVSTQKKANIAISFRTETANVILPPRLLKEYPQAMSIILENQFTDLLVKNNGFSVILVFDGISEKIYIPFYAITLFFDREADFSLRFKLQDDSNVTNSFIHTKKHSSKVISIKDFLKKY